MNDPASRENPYTDNRKQEPDEGVREQGRLLPATQGMDEGGRVQGEDARICADYAPEPRSKRYYEEQTSLQAARSPKGADDQRFARLRLRSSMRFRATKTPARRASAAAAPR